MCVEIYCLNNCLFFLDRSVTELEDPAVVREEREEDRKDADLGHVRDAGEGPEVRRGKGGQGQGREGGRGEPMTRMVTSILLT